MKRIILSLTLVAFAFVPALQAGDGKTAPATCPAQQATCPAEKASCPADTAKCDKGKACCAVEKAASCCSPKKPRLAKRFNPSIKGAQLLVMR